MTLALAFLMMSGSAGCQSEKAANMDLSTVENLNLKRYMGTWFEIARFDHSFERNLVGVTATYALQPNGKITVLNQGYKNPWMAS